MHPYQVVFCFVFCFVLLSTVFVLGKTINSKAVNKMNADQKQTKTKLTHLDIRVAMNTRI